MSEILTDDIQVRILWLLDGDLEDEELIRLDAELRSSREARVQFLKLSALHSALEIQGDAKAAIKNVPVIPIELHLTRQRQKMVRNSLFAAAAVVLLSLLGIWLKISSQPTSALAEFQLGPDSQFTLSHVGGDHPRSGNILGKGSRLQLSRGSVEGVFFSGVRFVIEAPCDFTVLDEDRISLTKGVAWFEVPHQAIGFTVQTKQLKIVDLGTRFGVVASEGKPHEIHVAFGTVELASQSELEKKSILKTGEARRLDSELGLKSIRMQQERFTQTLPVRIPIANPSFEANRNPSPDGDFIEGERRNIGGDLIGWATRTGEENEVSIGYRDINPSFLHPFPPIAGSKSQALTLISGASIQNLTGTPWASLRPGDKLTLTISLGMRYSHSDLNWNEKTFFGFTDGNADLATIELTDTVANSGIIANNPVTSNQYGDGTFKDVSFSHVVQPADIERSGNIGILIYAEGTGGMTTAHDQSHFDHVRLHLTRTANAPPEEH